MGSPAFQAGLGPSTKLVAINGHGYTEDVLKQAIRAAKGTSDPIELIVSNDNEFRTVRLNYHDGEKYPRLERVQGTTDLLDEILKPLAAGQGSGL
jgi:predicted metalloprotease with PDZ domain